MSFQFYSGVVPVLQSCRSSFMVVWFQFYGRVVPVLLGCGSSFTVVSSGRHAPSGVERGGGQGGLVPRGPGFLFYRKSVGDPGF